MPKIVTAAGSNGGGVPNILAATSVPNIKKKLKNYPQTEWELTEYQVKSTAAGLVEFVESFGRVSGNKVHVTAGGRVMADE